MKKSSAVLLSFLFSLSVHAVLGPQFNFAERPHSTCAIEFYKTNDKKTLTGVCSAVVIGPHQLLSAAHCMEGLPARAHRLICRASAQHKIKRVVINKNVDLSHMKTDENHRRYDTAYLESQELLNIPNMAVANTRAEFLDILNRAETCGLFGFGGFQTLDREKGHSSSVKIAPQKIKITDDLITINGFKGRAAGLVEPGDSGGSLACLTPEDQRWTHLAQISGRTMDGISILAPSYLFSDQLKTLEASDLEIQHQDIAVMWREQDEKIESNRCLKLLQRSGATIDEVQDLEDCLVKKKEFLKKELQDTESLKVRLKPFSLVDIDQSGGQIQLNSKNDDERLYLNDNPFSTVDHNFNQFNIKEINGSKVRGDLKIMGYSQNFSCLENILCEGGEFKNVQTDLESLSLPLLK